MFVAIVGLVNLGLPVSRSRKVLGFVMGIAGIGVILMSQVRSSLVVVVGAALIYSVTMVVQRRMRAVVTLAFWAVFCSVCGFLYLDLYGGKSTFDRFSTLLADDPWKVYEKSRRLDMVTGALDTLLVDHPIGAGLGRWGMMRRYFGNENNYDSPEIWAEVQFQAWVLDGGIVLLSLYLIAIGVAMQRVVRISLSHQSLRLRQWGAAIVVLSAGPVAFIFSYCPFNSQMGLQFWLLIGAFEGLVQGEVEHSATEDWDNAQSRSSSESVD
jgi:hypothetical protein